MERHAAPLRAKVTHGGGGAESNLHLTQNLGLDFKTRPIFKIGQISFFQFDHQINSRWSEFRQ
jgi:hypothetical protein